MEKKMNAARAGSGLVVLACVCLLTGCATPYPMGSLYTDLTLPQVATSNPGPAKKVGTATANSYFSLIATGDASIDTAARNGGITQIHSVDWKANSILGIVGTYTTTVRGN
ncbi:MAG TPA: TRL-like family protein [Kiritimatiellia bacterium]|nr:TRL-like family protein [Kiritimatiellia bacterium]